MIERFHPTFTRRGSLQELSVIFGSTYKAMGTWIITLTGRPELVIVIVVVVVVVAVVVDVGVDFDESDRPCLCGMATLTFWYVSIFRKIT